MLSYHITRINQNKPEWTTQVQRIEFDGQQKTNSPHLTKSNLWHPTPPPLAMCLSGARVAARRYVANHPHDQTKPRIPDRADEVIRWDFVRFRPEKIPVLPSGRFHMSSALTIEKNMEEFCTWQFCIVAGWVICFSNAKRSNRIWRCWFQDCQVRLTSAKNSQLELRKKWQLEQLIYIQYLNLSNADLICGRVTRGDLNLVIPAHLPRQNPSHPVDNHNHDDLGSHRITLHRILNSWKHGDHSRSASCQYQSTHTVYFSLLQSIPNNGIEKNLGIPYKEHPFC